MNAGCDATGPGFSGVILEAGKLLFSMKHF